LVARVFSSVIVAWAFQEPMGGHMPLVVGASSAYIHGLEAHAMIDTTTPKGKLIAAAFMLAETRDWADISLLEIADAAGMPLDEVRRAVGSKGQIISTFMRLVDDEMLKRAPTRVAVDARRDALFEVIMSRFDVLAPYKTALRSIAKAAPADTSLVMPYLNAQRWMLTAAGISADGVSGLVRTGGLASLYHSVFKTWLDDEDAGLARTMAALDRRLRRGESTIKSFDSAVAGVGRIATDLPGVLSETLGAIFKRRPTAGDAESNTHTPPKN
jgi:ubiquinone biosynthesis protein COQ9